jgi:hypothetical protein
MFAKKDVWNINGNGSLNILRAKLFGTSSI